MKDGYVGKISQITLSRDMRNGGGGVDTYTTHIIGLCSICRYLFDFFYKCRFHKVGWLQWHEISSRASISFPSLEAHNFLNYVNMHFLLYPNYT